MQTRIYCDEPVELQRAEIFTIKELESRQRSGKFLTRYEKDRLLRHAEYTRKSRLNQRKK